jgi:hypothetical protein
VGHAKVGCQVAQPPFVLGQRRAAGGDAGPLGACGVQEVADRGGGEGLAALERVTGVKFRGSPPASAQNPDPGRLQQA